jgi:hypothetical protein
MGWPSCYENDLERAHDQAFMMRGMEDGFRVKPSVARVNAAAPPQAAPPIVIHPAAFRTSAQRARDLRDVHILCLAELRPQYRNWPHGRGVHMTQL